MKKPWSCLFSFFFSADYFKFLSRSFSLPNLTFTPLESLLPTEDEMLEAALDYTDDTNFEPISPVKNLDENAMWHMESTSNIPDDPTLHSTDIFAYLETQRAILEEKIGVKALLRVYKMISKLGMFMFMNKYLIIFRESNFTKIFVFMFFQNTQLVMKK